PDAPATWPAHPAAPRLLAHLCAWARALMLSGAPLVHTVPGRAGWELRLVVQGGLRILDRIEANGFDTLHRRPRLRALDGVPMLWRAALM
ncbi:MAG: squalene synthase HpnC, partial [Comamonadaceae bacterium]